MVKLLGFWLDFSLTTASLDFFRPGLASKPENVSFLATLEPFVGFFLFLDLDLVAFLVLDFDLRMGDRALPFEARDGFLPVVNISLRRVLPLACRFFFVVVLEA
jgi:hypothetical protein